jgi:hypothetical protein
VQKEAPETGLFEPGIALTGFPSPVEQGETHVTTHEVQQITPESVPDINIESEVFDDTSLYPEPVDFSSLESPAIDAATISFESDDFNSSRTEADLEPTVKGGEVDFSSFDFGDVDSEPDVTSKTNMSDEDFTRSKIETKKVPQGLDFSDDDMFGAVVQSAPEVSDEAISFDFEGDSFTESMDMSGQDLNGKTGSFHTPDTPSDAPFSLGEIDFGDELTSVAVQQVNPEDLKTSHEDLFAPLAEAQKKSDDDELTRSFLGEESTGKQQELELPPLPIASRRKQSPVFGAVIAVVTVLVISVLGYLGYSSFSTSNETTDIETGNIGVRNVKAAFVENDEAGELLVITGEALNEYPKPRAALQVKVTVFDAQGQSIATKTAYGGNPLTEEQLESLPLDKIETAMANQFGDSLANMEVASGKAIPFVVVLANLPKGSKDFGVQSAGSTVATGK